MTNVTYADFQSEDKAHSLPIAENGFTQWNNNLKEALLRAPITFRQYKIFDAIHRMTIGWGKDYDRITDMQLSEITGIHRTHINRAKSELIKLNMLSMFGDKIGVNQNFQAWNFSSNVTKSATKQCSPNSYSVAKSVTKNVAKSATINKHKKNPFKTSRCNETVAKAATEHQNSDSVAESATKECSQTSYTPKKEKENKYNNIYISPIVPLTKKSELDLSKFEQLPSELVWADYLQHRKNKK
ncbi:MAG: replication protein, partial [Arsenophonus sp.]|nr:replication protein [Arsenophonus sp.]